MKTIYYFSGTHWDREWYTNFQNFRFQLVKVIDDIIDYLENNDEFGVFHFDGQTCVMKDYLLIRPENRERLTKLLKDGRIKIGPWFIMPDEFLPSGEALIRNLEFGHKVCEELGVEPMKVGYVCDCFGHTSQTPQIFSMFGIDCAMLWRGIGENNVGQFFNWEAPNGTAVTTYNITDMQGYGSFAICCCGRVSLDENKPPEDPEFKKNFIKYIDHEIERSIDGDIVIMDAIDHDYIHKNTPGYIKEIKKEYPDYDVYHGSIEKKFREIDRTVLETYSGALLKTCKDKFNHLIAHCLSSRIKLKQRNDYAQALLEKTVEPLSVFTDVDTKFIEVAWEYLLKNHFHDAICGCSADEVHRDMMYRFSQVENISNAIIEATMKKLRSSHKITKDGGYITVINTNPIKTEQSVLIDIPFDLDFPVYAEPFGYEDINTFELYLGDNKIPYEVVDIKRNRKVRYKNDIVEQLNVYTVAVTVIAL